MTVINFILQEDNAIKYLKDRFWTCPCPQYNLKRYDIRYWGMNNICLKYGIRVSYIPWHESGGISIYEINSTDVVSLPFSGCILVKFRIKSTNKYYAAHIHCSQDSSDDKLFWIKYLTEGKKDIELIQIFKPGLEKRTLPPNIDYVCWGVITSTNLCYSVFVSKNNVLLAICQEINQVPISTENFLNSMSVVACNRHVIFNRDRWNDYFQRNMQHHIIYTL